MESYFILTCCNPHLRTAPCGPAIVPHWTSKRRMALILRILKCETSTREAARRHGLTVSGQGLAGLSAFCLGGCRTRRSRKRPGRENLGVSCLASDGTADGADAGCPSHCRGVQIAAVLPGTKVAAGESPHSHQPSPHSRWLMMPPRRGLTVQEEKSSGTLS